MPMLRDCVSSFFFLEILGHRNRDLVYFNANKHCRITQPTLFII
jgi:hypothetical protein